MKRLTAILAVCILASCGKNNVEPQAESNQMLEEPVAGVAEADAKHPGQALVEGADCLTCHKIDSKLIGPSYQDVAAKYTEADIDQLATKIIEGSVGVWGEIPMTAHPGMSPENAKKMVEYILTLKQ